MEKKENPSWLQARLFSSTFIIFPGCRAITHKHINKVETQVEIPTLAQPSKFLFTYLHTLLKMDQL